MPGATSPKSIVIVGGGILGLAVAREVMRVHPGIEVTVVEKEDHVAAHQSGHNSGVVHAGLYYKPKSLKAVLCRRGGRLLRSFCDEHGVPYRELGKLVVASSQEELTGLAIIEERARRNGVPDLVRLDRPGMRDVEPFVEGVAALHSPHTAVVDYIAVCEALVRSIEELGGRLLLSSPAHSIREVANGIEVLAGNELLRTERAVVCAGLSSDATARLVGDPGDVRIVPFRGEYYALRPRVRDQVRGLIYPVPDPRYPFLGVHLTRTVHDDVLVGPNAIMALSYEGYRWRDAKLDDLARIARWPGTLGLAREHWRTGARELLSSLSKRVFASHARRYLPNLGSSDLVRARAGVRAQAVDRAGRLLDDFVLQDSGRLLLVRNAPSPAATSSLAIAEHVVSSMLKSA